MRCAIACVAAALLVGAGCGRGEVFASCDLRAQGQLQLRGTCQAWRGEQTGNFDALCTNTLMGVSGVTDCESNADVVGRCESDQAFGVFLTITYYAPAFTQTSARQSCTTSTTNCALSCEFFPPG